MEIELVSEAETPFPSEFEFLAHSTGGEVDDDEMPFLVEVGGGGG